MYELLEKGAITQEEYEGHKALLLNQARGASPMSDEYSSDPAQVKPAGEVPQIIINQSSSIVASASATAVAKNGGCLKSVFAAIGFLVLIGVILKACSSDEKTVSSKSASEPAAQIVSNTVNQKATQENIQAVLQTAKQENTAVNNEINALWTDMDADVRNHLKPQ
ncbi:SHOCT domain-containing protein [Snodgrassella communis]|uniref:SHOCT domain-containing protein n=1 Tax=Snodgrassella communis TaxID=2946699 RepID=UPI001EF60D38|nr:SHOCT domain-containing protein [Snodgrassella communis]